MKRTIISIVLPMIIQALILLAIYLIRRNEDVLASWAITCAIGTVLGWHDHVKKNY